MKALKNMGHVENDERFQVAGNQVCVCQCVYLCESVCEMCVLCIVARGCGA